MNASDSAMPLITPISFARFVSTPKIGRAHAELQSPCNLVCRLLLEKKNRATATGDAMPTQVSNLVATKVQDCDDELDCNDDSCEAPLRCVHAAKVARTTCDHGNQCR